jgi:hypothetical protein
MQLHSARLCVNCDEVHDALSCPRCASEEFAYLTRWVPAPERRVTTRTAPSERAAGEPGAGPSGAASGRAARLAGYGALGLVVAGAARWWWKARQHAEAVALRGAGELR